MNVSLEVLCISAATIALVHTAMGPDHYLPFVALSKNRKWSFSKTISVTLLCGVGHVLSSIIIGLIGVAWGITLKSLVDLEAMRGDIASWLLIITGLIYFAWGINRGFKHKHHVHTHASPKSTTTWALFLIFLFGPCEPLIPLLMFPAATIDFASVALVAGIFSIVTLATMTTIVCTIRYGLDFIKIPHNNYGHAMVGGVIFLCGLGVRLGL